MQNVALAKIFCLPYDTLYKLNYNSSKKKKIEQIPYEHHFVFSRMRGIENEDLEYGAWRYLFAEKNQFYVGKIRKDENDLNSERIPYVFKFNEETMTYEPFCTVKDFTDNDEYMELLKKATEAKTVLTRLTGQEEKDLTHKDFANPEAVDIILKNGDKEYVCKKIPKKQVIGNFYIPVVSDNKIGFEWHTLNYSNSFYRTTNHPAMTSFVFVPKDYPIMFRHDINQDQEMGKMEVYLDDYNIFADVCEHTYVNETDFEKDEHMVSEMARHAIPKDVLEKQLIDINDENTRVFFVAP